MKFKEDEMDEAEEEIIENVNGQNRMEKKGLEKRECFKKRQQMLPIILYKKVMTVWHFSGEK
jgi:hypothetical protein